MPQQRPRMPQDSPAHDEMDPNRQVIDEFRASGGTVGGRFAGLPLLLLTTIGARSGRRRTVPVTYVADGERYVVAAGANGANPAWYHNLLTRPAVTVEVGTAVLEALARVAAGTERDRLFDRYASEQPQLLSYQAMADREVPVIVLTPARPSLAPRTPSPAAADAGPASSAAVPEARQ
jgi:deazaflavin-dependent oxidoreductase (nitroreductase family)